MIITSQKTLRELGLQGAEYVTWVGSKVIIIKGKGRNYCQADDEMILNYEALLPRIKTINGLENCEFGLSDCTRKFGRDLTYVAKGLLFAIPTSNHQARDNQPN